VIVTLTTFDHFEGSKAGNGPQEGPGDRGEAWGWLEGQAEKKWVTWASRRES